MMGLVAAALPLATPAMAQDAGQKLLFACTGKIVYCQSQPDIVCGKEIGPVTEKYIIDLQQSTVSVGSTSYAAVIDDKRIKVAFKKRPSLRSERLIFDLDIDRKSGKVTRLETEDKAGQSTNAYFNGTCETATAASTQ